LQSILKKAKGTRQSARPTLLVEEVKNVKTSILPPLSAVFSFFCSNFARESYKKTNKRNGR